MSAMRRHTLFSVSLLTVTLAGDANAAPQPSLVATVDTGRYPDAVCNDGQAATFNYVLTRDTGPGLDGVDHRQKWLVVLSGGGECHDMKTCADRWREGPGSPFHDEGPGDHFNMMPDLSAQFRRPRHPRLRRGRSPGRGPRRRRDDQPVPRHER